MGTLEVRCGLKSTWKSIMVILAITLRSIYPKHLKHNKGEQSNVFVVEEKYSDIV